MAQIPDPGAPQSVLPDRIADTPQSVSTSPQAFGGGLAQGLDQVAQGADQASSNFASTAMSEAQLANQTAINAKFSQLNQKANTLAFGDPTTGAKGFYATRGQDTLTAYPDVVNQLNKARDDLATGLSPMAAQQFEEESRRLVSQNLQGFGQHQQEQAHVYAQSTADATVEADRQSAILYRDDPVRFNQSLTDARNTITSYSATNGDAPVVTQGKLDDFTSKSYAGAALADATTDPVKAWNFYQNHQNVILGADQVQVERTLKPELYTWSSRTDADNIMSGATGSVAQGVAAEAQKQGVDPVLALTTAKIESGMGSRLQAPGSSAFGVFQLMPSTWAANGGTATNRGDTGTQISLGVKNLASSAAIANEALGGNAAPADVYLVHQQGAGGGAALLKADPSMSAVAALAPAYGGNVQLATKAITGNGGSATMTVGQFRSMWSDHFQQVASTVSVPAPGTAPGTPTSTDPRDHVQDWLSQAAGITSPLGTPDPVYADLVQSRIRAKAGEIDYGQAQTDRANQNTLLSAALGLTAATPSAPPPSPPTVGAPANSAVNAPPPNTPSPPPSVAPGLDAVAAKATGAPLTARPTSIDQLLAISPAVRQAWAGASPEAQRGILGMIERNATEGPPTTPAAQARYYSLLSESTNDPTSFLKENLADPNLLATLPRGMVSQLMNRQVSIDGKQAEQQDRVATMTHARAVVMPDLIAAGINPRAASAPNATQPQRQAYADFDGRLDEALQSFQQSNNRRPNDAEIKTIGQTLLTPGFQSGTGHLWGVIGPTQERLYQAQTGGTTGSFMPQVPPADRTQIVSAYAALHGGAKPTDGEISTYYMAGRSRMPAPLPGRPRMPSAPQPGARMPLPVPVQTASTAPGSVANPYVQADTDSDDGAFGQ